MKTDRLLLLLVVVLLCVASMSAQKEVNTQLHYHLYTGGGIVSTQPSNGFNGYTQEFGLRVELNPVAAASWFLDGSIQKLNGLNEGVLYMDRAYGQNAYIETVNFRQIDWTTNGSIGVGMRWKPSPNSKWGMVGGGKLLFRLMSRTQSYQHRVLANIYQDIDEREFALSSSEVIEVGSTGNMNANGSGLLTRLNVAPFIGVSRQVTKGLSLEVTASKYLLNILDSSEFYGLERKPFTVDARLLIRLN